jgi:hypothetical protein
MEDYMDDFESYKKFKLLCRCRCDKHCGFSCMTDDCDCTECNCLTCQEQSNIIKSSN